MEKGTMVIHVETNKCDWQWTETENMRNESRNNIYIVSNTVELYYHTYFKN
jgi:hypothetical protein